ncbi:DUF6305 family protein, partial [Bacteroidota bacterium]
LVLCLIVSFSFTGIIAQTAEEPVLLTSCGQSPGPNRLKIFMKRLALNYDYNTMATPEDLINKKDEGNPYCNRCQFERNGSCRRFC